MKFEKQDLDLENGLKKEWIITNGLGGYASSTIIGANTRRYHGLFIAPLNPPAKRYLILSKLDESIEIKGKKYELFTNIGKNYISDGYKFLDSFSKEILPIFKYSVKDVSITKTICMIYRRNTVLVYYKIRNGKDRAKLILAPVMNFRDFHGMNTDHEFNLSQQISGNKVKITIDNNSSTPIYLYSTDGSYIEHFNDTYRDMFYIEEEKRGFHPVENHVVSGRYEVELKPGEEKEISFICSLDDNIEETEPKYVIAMGACACSGGMFKNNSYSVVNGVDKIIPVDIYLPMCPPTPESLLNAIIELQKKIREENIFDREEIISSHKSPLRYDIDQKDLLIYLDDTQYFEIEVD